MSKRCCRCKTEKPLTDFWPSQIRCKECCRAYKRTEAALKKSREAHRKWYAKNKRRAYDISMAWRNKHREAYRSWQKNYTHQIRTKRRNYLLLRTYGITTQEYEARLKKQGHVCACCGTHTPGHKGKFVVDHCHLSGKVRGLLCNNCNQALGLMRDSIGYGLSLVAYLARTGGVEHYAGCQPYIDESAREILDTLARNAWRRVEMPNAECRMEQETHGDPAWN